MSVQKHNATDFENLPHVDLGIDVSNDWIALWEKFCLENKLSVELPYKNPKDRRQQSVNAYEMLTYIVEIKRGKWIPDWNNSSEPKYYPWFYMDAKRGFAFCDTVSDFATSNVGSRLCFPSAELCEEVAKEFLAIYRIYFTEI